MNPTPTPERIQKIPTSRWLVVGLVSALGLLNSPTTVRAVQLEWDTELLSMDLNAHSVLLPLGPGWSPMLVDIHVGESANLASRGKVFASSTLGGQSLGDQYFVESLFDLYFDLRITDVDPAVNFGGGPTDGLSLGFPSTGPAHFQNFYLALSDPQLPNFGLIPPPQAAPSIGGFNIEIPVGADLNGNGENDKIKFTLMALAAGDANRTFITLPDGTVINNFDTTLDLSGAVVDVSQDPPFGPITLTGPTTASSRLVTSSVPDSGSTLALLLGSCAAVLGLRRFCPLQAWEGKE